MKLQQFDPKIVSITQLRRNIYALEGILAKEEEAFVMRNQDLIIDLNPFFNNCIIQRTPIDTSISTDLNTITNVNTT